MKLLDKNKFYRRPHWHKTTYSMVFFGWNDEEEAWCYVDHIEDDGTVVFKDAFHEGNRKKGLKSRVGRGVLNSNDLIEYKITRRNSMRKLIGKYTMVQVVITHTINGDAHYEWIKNPGIDIKEDDRVVVESGNEKLRCAKVKSVIDDTFTEEFIEAEEKAGGWLVGRFDSSLFEEKIKATRRKEFVLKELERRKEEFDSHKVWEFLAQTDPRAAELVEELKKLESF